MLDHIVELVGLLGMALLHSRDNVHHPAPGLCGPEMTSRAKENKLCDVAVVEANSTTIWPAVFPNLEPDDVGLVFKPPCLHRLKAPR